MTQSRLPLDWMTTSDPNVHIYARTDLKSLISTDWFEPAFWHLKQQISGTSQGRFTTYFIDYKDHNNLQKNMVLRHYYRGGLVRHISKDKFVYTGIEKTRCYMELEMLAQMTALGLPVPKPVAARIRRQGLFCTNDILIETIAGAKDGYHRLRAGKLSEKTWFDIGATIKRFHQENVFHSDLNIHNILIDGDHKVYLIDFDNCCFRAQDGKWPQQNLQRLLRSLEKESANFSDFRFVASNWQQLLAGYHS